MNMTIIVIFQEGGNERIIYADSSKRKGNEQYQMVIAINNIGIKTKKKFVNMVEMEQKGHRLKFETLTEHQLQTRA